MGASKEALSQKQATWYKHVEAQRISGLTQTEYCRRNELNYAQFHYYAQARKSKPMKVEEPSSSFIPLQINHRESPKTFTLEQTDGSILSWSADWSVGQVVEFLSGWRRS